MRVNGILPMVPGSKYQASDMVWSSSETEAIWPTDEMQILPSQGIYPGS